MSKNEPGKKILYIDMVGVVANFEKGIKVNVTNWDELSDTEKGDLTDKVCGGIPNFFLNIEPIEGAIKNEINYSGNKKLDK